MRRIIGLLFVLLPVLLVGWVTFNSRDLASVDDADLAVARTPGVSAAHNAFPALTATALACEDDGEARAALKQRDDVAALARVVDGHAAVLDAIASALERPHFQIPPAEPDVSDTDPLRAISCLARRLAGSAALHRERGERAAALSDLLLALRLGKRLHEAEGAGLVHGMIAVTIHEIALEELERWVAASAVERDEVRRTVPQLEAARLPRERWSSLFAVEYEGMKNALAPVMAEASAPFEATGTEWLGFVPAAYVFHPNRTLDAIATDYRELGRRAASGCATRLVEPTGAFSSWNYVAPNAIGHILTHIAQPDYDRYHRRACTVDARLSAAQALVALRAHQAAYGSLPEDLAALVPDLLPALPRDPFDGEPLRYSRAEKRLWAAALPPSARDHEHDADCPASHEPAKTDFPIRF